MAQSNRESLKRNLLLGYLVICVALVGAILTNGLIGDENEGQPGFYRPTAESFEAIYNAQTEAAEYFDSGATSTPHEGAGEGGGGGGGGNHATATATPDPHAQETLDAIPTIED